MPMCMRAASRAFGCAAAVGAMLCATHALGDEWQSLAARIGLESKVLAASGASAEDVQAALAAIAGALPEREEVASASAAYVAAAEALATGLAQEIPEEIDIAALTLQVAT